MVGPVSPGVRRLSRIIPRNGTEAVPYIDMPKLCEFHTPSVSQRPVERAQWRYLTTGLPERNASGGSPQKIPRFFGNGGFS